jgi:hypothetical protein
MAALETTPALLCDRALGALERPNSCRRGYPP